MRPKRRAQLQTRILLWTFVPAAILLSAVAFTIYFAYQGVTEDLVLGRNQQLAHLSASQLAADLNQYVDSLNTLARSPDLYAGTPQRQFAVLENAAGQMAAFDGGLIVLTPTGDVTATTPGPVGLLGQDWSNRAVFRDVLRGAPASYSDVIADGEDGQAFLAIAVPMLNNRGEFRGTLVGLMAVGPNRRSAFYGGIVKLRLGQEGSLFLVDGTGRVFYHADEARIGQDLHDQPDVARVLQGQAGTLRMRNRDGVDVLATFAPIPGTPWGLVTEENWTSLLAASRGYGQFLLLLLFVGILMPAIYVELGVRRITEPVVRLTAAARQIAGGEYGMQTDIHTGDELEELGQQFNQMSSELQQSYAQLEQRVAARTRELAALNTTAAVASHSLNLHEILSDALDKTLEVLEMETGVAYSVEGNSLVLVAHRQRTEEFLQQASQAPLQGTVVEVAGEAGRPLAWTMEEFPDTRLKPMLEREGLAQIVCVPLTAKRKLVGAFTLGTRGERRITAEELSLLAAIGQQIGVAVENAHLYQQAEETAAAAERTRLARELHDAVTQTLFSASLIAEVLPDVWEASEDEGKRRLEELRQLTRGALAEMRTLLVELRPNALVQIPLPDLVRQLCESMVGRARLPIEISIEGQRRLPPDVQVALYRITQEALNNVVKHSKATQAVVTLRLHGRVHLSIADDGCGFDTAGVTAQHLGLRIMRERADAIGARLTINSDPGEGSQVTVSWQGAGTEGEPK